METDDQLRERLLKLVKPWCEANEITRAIVTNASGEQLDRFAELNGAKRIIWIPVDKLDPDPASAPKDNPELYAHLASMGLAAPAPQPPIVRITTREQAVARFGEGAIAAVFDGATKVIHVGQHWNWNGSDSNPIEDLQYRNQYSADRMSRLPSIPGCHVCGTTKHGMRQHEATGERWLCEYCDEGRLIVIRTVARRMLNEQIKHGGGHDSDEAYARCIERTRLELTLLEWVERGLGMVGELGEEFAFGEGDWLGMNPEERDDGPPSKARGREYEWSDVPGMGMRIRKVDE